MNNPCPVVKKENAFEDTMFLIDLLKQSKEKENIKRKVKALKLSRGQCNPINPFFVVF